ncbi:MAG TPA: cytochrome c [Gaiellaceae bacterium]|nr:cytochrome c [Gaiellaceae bacterium]
MRAASGWLLAAGALALSGCGATGFSPSQPARAVRLTAQERHGKALFVSTCGACHTLANAGTHGTAGTDLDDHPWRDVYVREVIDSGPGLMPDGLLTGSDEAAVAAYVAAVTQR